MPTTSNKPSSPLQARWNGLVTLLRAHPSMMLSIALRIILAVALEFYLDWLLEEVLGPYMEEMELELPILQLPIGALLATPLAFLIGHAIQPIIHSVCFLLFDDRFLTMSLEATGIKNKLVSSGSTKANKWHRMTFIEKFSTRYVMKAVASWCVGLAGWWAMIPWLGPVFPALLAGWVVAWDYVYIALSGIGHYGVMAQCKAVYRNFWEFFWFGFWAVLLEEIPVIGPACHVYNVYSAAFFLERLYLRKTGAAGGGGVTSKDKDL